MSDNLFSLWTYRAFPTQVIDGDTIEVCIDHGMHVQSIQRVRLLGVDAPELFSGDNRIAAQMAQQALTEWLNDIPEHTQWPLIVTTTKDKRSFNRYLGTVMRVSDSSDLGTWLVDQGHATRL